MSKQFWAVIVAVVLVFVGIAVFTGDKSDKESTGNSKGTPTSHIKGEGAAGVTLVEYGDFQCPYCQTYHATLQQVMVEYGDKIKFQYRHFPLTSIHQNAFAASRAAEAADKQGKFWEMYDLLFQNNDPNGATGWVVSNAPSTFFNRYAEQLKLDLEKFKTDYASSAVNNAVNADVAAGNKLKVNSTPTFFLNGKKVTINNTVDDFRKVLDAAIKEKAGASAE